MGHTDVKFTRQFVRMTEEVQYYTYLVRPWSIGLGEPHYDQRQHRTSIKDPSSKAEEIDQRIDSAGNYHGHRNERLQRKAKHQSFGDK